MCTTSSASIWNGVHLRLAIAHPSWCRSAPPGATSKRTDHSSRNWLRNRESWRADAATVGPGSAGVPIAAPTPRFDGTAAGSGLVSFSLFPPSNMTTSPVPAIGGT